MDNSTLQNIGLFILRIGTAGIMIPHGWSKLMMFVNGKASEFADPIGIGAIPSLALSGGAELLGSALIIIGLFTRQASAILAVNMAVATVFAYQNFPDNAEFAALFFVAALAITFTGAGKYSFDGFLKKNK